MAQLKKFLSISFASLNNSDSKNLTSKSLNRSVFKTELLLIATDHFIFDLSISSLPHMELNQGLAALLPRAAKQAIWLCDTSANFSYNLLPIPSIPLSPFGTSFASA